MTVLRLSLEQFERLQAGGRGVVIGPQTKKSAGLPPVYKSGVQPAKARTAVQRPAWPQRHKFNAVPDSRGGINFPSKSEALYYDLLVLKQRAGQLVFFLMQVPFRIPGSVYRLDFMEFWADGSITFTDVKGFATEGFKIKRRAVEVCYPVKIRTVKQHGRGHARTWIYA